MRRPGPVWALGVANRLHIRHTRFAFTLHKGRPALATGRLSTGVAGGACAPDERFARLPVPGTPGDGGRRAASKDRIS
jgi:hypothetical protein